MNWSTVLIIPAALRDAGNQVAEAMGWGTGNYSVPLSPAGSEPATHYGLHAWASEQFKAWVEGTEPLPEGMEAAQPVIDALIYSFRADLMNAEHFDTVAAANNLQRVEAAE